MDTQIIRTKRFEKQLEKLPIDTQNSVQKTIDLLVAHPTHSALRCHKYKRAKGVWICYVNGGERLFYQRKDEQLILLGVGVHALNDHVWHWKICE